MLEKVCFPYSCLFSISIKLGSQNLHGLFVLCLENNAGTLGVERREETKEESPLHSESETQEKTVGKRAGLQGLPIWPLFQASLLFHRKEGAEHCCHQRRSIGILLGRDSHLSQPAKDKGWISKGQKWQVTNKSIHVLFFTEKIA